MSFNIIQITMKRTVILLLLIAMIANCAAQDKNNEEEAIKKVIQVSYVEGLQNEGDLQKIEYGFHPDFNMLGIDKGDKMWKLPITDWKKRQSEKRNSGQLPLTGDQKVSVIFKSIDISGTAAVAKIEFYIGENMTFIDYISLYKFESGWKIVSKIFYKTKQ